MACEQIGCAAGAPTSRSPPGGAQMVSVRAGAILGEGRAWGKPSPGSPRHPLRWLLLPSPLNLCGLGRQRRFPSSRDPAAPADPFADTVLMSDPRRISPGALRTIKLFRQQFPYSCFQSVDSELRPPRNLKV